MANIFTEVLILTGFATLLVSLCLKFNIPSIIGFILTGLVVGPTGLKLINSIPDVGMLTEAVGILLMFTIGLEFSKQKLIELKHQFIFLGPAQVLITIIVTFFCVTFFTNIPWQNAVIWGFLISLSSTALVLKLLHENRDMNSPLGQNSLGILIFQDIAVIIMLVFMPILATTQNNNSQDQNLLPIVKWFASAVGVLLVSGLLGRYILPKVLTIIVKRRSQELFFFSILFLTLLASEAYHLAGLSASLGAFIAGFLLAESDFSNHAASLFVPLRDTLLGLFFATIGSLIDLNFLISHIIQIVGLALILLCAKSLIILSIIKFFKGAMSTSIMTGLTLSQVGEFAFLLAARAIDLGIFSKEENQYFMSISVVTMIATPFLYRLAPYFSRISPKDIWADINKGSIASKVTRQLSRINDNKLSSIVGEKISPQDKDEIQPTILIGFGIAGQNVARALTSLEVPIHVIEMNYNIVKDSKYSGVRVIFGDATLPETLHHAGIETAKLVVITVSSDAAVPRIIDAIRRERPDIEIIVRLQFVKDAQKIKLDDRTKLIVAEVETALEILGETIGFYGADQDVISSLIDDARIKITSQTQIGVKPSSITGPNWSIGAMLKPYKVSKGDFVVGQTLIGLSLPQSIGASIAMVYRDGFGASIPHGHFVIEEGDILQILTIQNETKKVYEYLKTGILI